MEVNDYMDLNTTELFVDSDESNDTNEEDQNVETMVLDSDDDNLATTYSPDGQGSGNEIEDLTSADAELGAGDMVSLNFCF